MKKNHILPVYLAIAMSTHVPALYADWLSSATDYVKKVKNAKDPLLRLLDKDNANQPLTKEEKEEARKEYEERYNKVMQEYRTAHPVEEKKVETGCYISVQVKKDASSKQDARSIDMVKKGMYFPTSKECFEASGGIVPVNECIRCLDEEEEIATRPPVDAATLQKNITEKCGSYKRTDATSSYQGDLNNPNNPHIHDCQNIVTVAKAAADPKYPNSIHAVNDLFKRWFTCAQAYYHEELGNINWLYVEQSNQQLDTDASWFRQHLEKAPAQNYPHFFAPLNPGAPELDPAKQDLHFQECLALPDKDTEKISKQHPDPIDIAHIDVIMKKNAQDDIVTQIVLDQAKSKKAAEQSAEKQAAELKTLRQPLDQETLQKTINQQCATYQYVNDTIHKYGDDLNNPKNSRPDDCQNALTTLVANYPQYPNSIYAINQLLPRWQQCAQVYYQAWNEKRLPTHEELTNIIMHKLMTNYHTQALFSDPKKAKKEAERQIETLGYSKAYKYNVGNWRPPLPNNYPYQFAPYNSKTKTMLDPAKQNQHFQECLALPDKDLKNNDLQHINDIVRQQVKEDLATANKE